MEEFEEEGLYVINTDTKSRMGGTGQLDSNLDLIFSNEDLIDEIRYKQVEDSWGSDHYLIEFEIKENYETYRKRTNRISSKKTRWKEYTEYMRKEEEFLGKEEYQNMEEEVKYIWITEKMKEVVRLSSGKKQKERRGVENRDRTGKTGRKRDTEKRINPVEWWDEECEKVIEERKEALKKFRKEKSLESWINFKKHKALARRTIKGKKKENLLTSQVG